MRSTASRRICFWRQCSKRTTAPFTSVDIGAPAMACWVVARMDWLKNNAYIAGWLSPAIALIGMLIRGGGKSGEIDWARMMLFIGFLTCLAAAFTPAVGDGARFFAGSKAEHTSELQ